MSNSEDLKSKLSAALQAQIPGLIDNLTNWLENPYNNPNKSFLENGKIKSEFFEAEQIKPFLEQMEKALQKSVITCSENQMQAKYEVAAAEAKIVADNITQKHKIFQDNCRVVFNVEPESELEQERFERVIKPMLEKISAHPEEEITTQEQYDQFRQKFDNSVLDISSLPDSSMTKEEEEKLLAGILERRKNKIRITAFKKIETPKIEEEQEEEFIAPEKKYQKVNK